MKNFVLLLSSFCLLFANSSPCDDELYVELKKKNINEMSDREYEYFINKDKQCNESILSNNNFSDQFDNFEISQLKNRKMLDLIGLTTVYSLTLLGDAITDDGLDVPYLLIPGIGPFLSFIPSDEYNIEESKTVLLISGFVQMGFLIDFLKTSNKINKMESGFSYYINPNPVHPTITVAYNFK